MSERPRRNRHTQLIKTVIAQALADTSAWCREAPYAMAPTLELLRNCYQAAQYEIASSSAGVWRLRVTLAQAAWILQHAAWRWSAVDDDIAPPVPNLLVHATRLLRDALEDLQLDSTSAEALISPLSALAADIYDNAQMAAVIVQAEADLAVRLRRGFSLAGYILGRASAALWQTILNQQAENDPSQPSMAHLPSPTPKDIQAYRQALRHFADLVTTLLTPSDLAPDARDAEEAQALNDVLGPLLARQQALRSWTHPEAFVTHDWSTQGGRSADRADRRLALFNDNALELVGTVRGWSLRGHEETETEMVDLLADLQCLANTSGLDWDSLLARANHIAVSEGKQDLAFHD